MIPAFVHGRVFRHDMLIAWAVFIVITDNPAGLQVGIDRDRTDIFEAALLQIFADPVRKPVAHRDRSCRMSLVEDCFTAGKAPHVIAEGAELLPDFPVTPGVVDHGLHLSLGADHAFRVQDALDIRFVISGDLIIIKVVKALPEYLPLLQHQIPGEAALQAF